jgi:predicted ester cyclase
VWGKDNVDVADEIFAQEYVRHDLRPTQALPGPEGQKRIATDFRAAFPDLQFHVDLIFGEDDLVAGRWTARGTHTGRWGSLAPTGKRAEFSAVNLFLFANGKVVELWNHRDDLGLMQQVGATIFAGAASSGA